MEKEVKKTRQKKQKAVETLKEEVAGNTPKEVVEEVAAVKDEVAAAEVAPKKARKPRTKKAATPKAEAVEEAAMPVEKSIETPAELVEEAANEKAEERPVEKAVESQQEKPKTAKKSRSKKAEKKEEKVAEKPAVQEEKREMTRAEKKDAVRAIVKDLLGKKVLRRSVLIDEASRLYVEKYPSQETANVNDVKGRVGSVITLMEQSEEIFYVEGKMRLEKPPVEVAIKEETTQEKAVQKEAEKEAEPVPAPVKEEFLPVPVPESKLAPVFDLSDLLGEKAAGKAKKPAKGKDEKKTDEVKEKPIEKTAKKSTKKAEDKQEKVSVKRSAKPSQDKLKEKFLKKIRSHGGSYLEYYAIYLLQRYAQANGRRLEGLRVCGGKADGGIDGEIEVSDRFGFRETLYVQAKNWEPTDEKWMVGETLLQQFIGAVTYRMVQEGKSHGRGVYVTTSKFSEGAKRMLEDMSETYVGYDGDDLFDLAKECNFGVVQKDGEWVLDDNLLSGEKAFFNM